MSEEKKDRIPRTMVGKVDTPFSQTTAHQTATLPSTGKEAGDRPRGGRARKATLTTAHQTATLPSTGKEAGDKAQPSNVPQNQPEPAANDEGERKP